MRGKIFALILLLVSAVVLFSCSNESGSKSGDVTDVKMIYWPGPESDAMQHVVDAYNEGQGKEDNVSVEMVLISRGGTYEREATMMSSKSDEVDIYFTASYIVGQHAPSLDPLTNDLSFDNHMDVSVDALTMDGEVMAVPMDVSNHFLFYREDLIDQLLTDETWITKYEELSQEILGKALEPKSPDNWTWEDFLVSSAFFSQDFNSDSPTRYGTVLQLRNLIFNVMIWDDVLYSMGGSWLDDEGNINIDSPEALEAVNLYKDIYVNGYTSPDTTVAEFPEAQEAFKSNNAAFMIQWAAANTELTDPEQSGEIAEHVGVAPIPGESSTHVHSLGVGLNKYSNNKEAALKWMDYLTTEDAMTIYAENGGVPSIASVLTKLEEQNPIFPTISEHISNYGYSIPTLPETQEILQIIAEELSPAWIGELDGKEALENAQSKIEELLE